MSELAYRLVTPSGWDRIPLEPLRRRRAISAISARQFRGIENAPHIRAQLESSLNQEAERAYLVGGIEMYMSSVLVGPTPLASALTVSAAPLRATDDGDRLAAVVADWLVGDEELLVEECDVVETGVGPAVRRTSCRQTLITDGVGEKPKDSFVLEWLFPAPGQVDSAILLTFSTVLIPIKDSMAGLFDAVASTFSWQVPATKA